MKRFLYVSPYFPPSARVGAQRPAKLARHLVAHGWEAVVLCDLRSGEPRDETFLASLPAEVEVVRDYSRGARRRERLWRQHRLSEKRARRAADRLPGPLASPELLPLGEHSPRILHATRAGARLLRNRNCEAILINADPYAALLVGARLGRQFGLPYVMDLRDPWALCDLRRRRRPPFARAIVDRLERRIVAAAARVVMNTRTAAETYRNHYVDIDPGRFTWIRNASDAALWAAGTAEQEERFTVAIVGGFRRFVTGEVVIDALRVLQQRGVGQERLRLVLYGDYPEATRARAAAAGVLGVIEQRNPVPYSEVGSAMRGAGLLLAIGHDTRQRIPNKVYDYAHSDRPVLVVQDNPELREVVGGLPGVDIVGGQDPEAIAGAIERVLEAGPNRFDRDAIDLDAAAAAARMAEVLDRAASRA